MSEKYKVLACKDGKVTIPRPLRIAMGLAYHESVIFEQISPDMILLRRLHETEAPTEMPSLLELLESLSDRQRIAARYYLSGRSPCQEKSEGKDSV